MALFGDCFRIMKFFKETLPWGFGISRTQVLMPACVKLLAVAYGLCPRCVVYPRFFGTETRDSSCSRGVAREKFEKILVHVVLEIDCFIILVSLEPKVDSIRFSTLFVYPLKIRERILWYFQKDFFCITSRKMLARILADIRSYWSDFIWNLAKWIVWKFIFVNFILICRHLTKAFFPNKIRIRWETPQAWIIFAS